MGNSKAGNLKLDLRKGGGGWKGEEKKGPSIAMEKNRRRPVD